MDAIAFYLLSFFIGIW